MPLLQHLSDLRYAKAVETYAREAGRYNPLRAGTATAAAVVARAAQHADAPDLVLPTSAEPLAAGASVAQKATSSMVVHALGMAAKGVGTLAEMEQMVSSPFARLPFPACPALRVWDLDIGLPHAHNHPPNVVPPSPVPIPLPSMGPIIPILMVSGASTVLINGLPAARCGDMGLGVFCGGFFPMYEVAQGSSNTWIQGARAARLLVDTVKHCTFSAPKPSDPPLGPMLGMTIPPSSPSVLIGGVPMPSLFSMAVAHAFKAVFKVGHQALRKATAKAYVDKLLKKGLLLVDPAGTAPSWADDILADLWKIASTRTGREVLKRIETRGRTVHILHYDGFFPTPGGHSLNPRNAWAAPTTIDGMLDMTTGLKRRGSDAMVAHDPAQWTQHHGADLPRAPGTSSDSILFHELNHATNATEGGMRHEGLSSVTDWDERWTNFEEYDTVATENGYRSETGLPPRADYNTNLP